MQPSTTCAICHRALSDPASVERGIGPICAGTFARPRGGDMFNGPRSSYEIRQVDGDFVWIVDLDLEGARSVTNDAELVVAELAKVYGDRRIIYRDSMGNWDELQHDGERFTGFRPARDLALA